MNEAYSLIAASNSLAFVVDCFVKRYSSQFTFKVLLVVFSVPSDHRKDKDSDYVIVRLRSKRTIAVIELKSSVSPRLGDGDRDPIAKLLYEQSILRHYYTLKQCCAKPGILQPCSVFKACWLSLALANACFLVV